MIQTWAWAADAAVNTKLKKVSIEKYSVYDFKRLNTEKNNMINGDICIDNFNLWYVCVNKSFLPLF